MLLSPLPWRCLKPIWRAGTALCCGLDESPSLLSLVIPPSPSKPWRELGKDEASSSGESEAHPGQLFMHKKLHRLLVDPDTSKSHPSTCQPHEDRLCLQGISPAGSTLGTGSSHSLCWGEPRGTHTGEAQPLTASPAGCARCLFLQLLIIITVCKSVADHSN